MTPTITLQALAGWTLVIAACTLSCDRTSTDNPDRPTDPVGIARPAAEAGEPMVRDAPIRERSELEKRAAAIRAALVSVEHHALREPPDLPPEVMPIPLARAVRTLREDANDNPFGESRRRRSITALIVGGVDPSASPPEIRRHKEEIDVLLGPQKAEFDVFLTALLPRVFVAPVPLALDSDPQLAEFAQEIQAFLDSGGPAVPNCDPDGPPPAAIRNITKGPAPTLSCSGTALPPGWTWEQTSIEVSRPGGVAALAAALDPQNWDAHLECNPFFVGAYVVDSNKAKLACLPFGKDWSNLLYEEFLMSVESSEAQLVTILKIDADLDPVADTHRFDYCLHESVSGIASFGPDNEWSGSIDVDEGFQTIDETASGALKVVADKKLHFEDWKHATNGNDKTGKMNDAASPQLMAMGSALKEAVCCPAPSPVCP
jgi:hypothetical protein